MLESVFPLSKYELDEKLKDKIIDFDDLGNHIVTKEFKPELEDHSSKIVVDKERLINDFYIVDGHKKTIIFYFTKFIIYFSFYLLFFYLIISIS